MSFVLRVVSVSVFGQIEQISESDVAWTRTDHFELGVLLLRR